MVCVKKPTPANAIATFEMVSERWTKQIRNRIVPKKYNAKVSWKKTMATVSYALEKMNKKPVLEYRYAF